MGNLLNKGNKNLKLIICGARGYASRAVTPYINKLYKSARKYPNNIFFTGSVAHNQIQKFYLMSDYVVIPSEVEEARVSLEKARLRKKIAEKHRQRGPHSSH